MVHVPQLACIAQAMGETLAGPQVNNGRFVPSRAQATGFVKRGPPGLELPVQAAAWGQPMKIVTKSMDTAFSFPPGLAWDKEVLELMCPMGEPQGRTASGCSESDASQGSDAGELRSSPANSTSTSALLLVSNAIADLQELLQTVEHCRRFRCPPGASVLQWTFTMQRKDSRVLHRAVAAFLHDGVPMHVAGPRCYSKKTARQSTSEMALALVRSLNRRKDVGILEDGCAFVELADVLPGGGKGVKPGDAHVDQLRRFCSESFGNTELQMQFNSDDGTATVQLSVMGVLNTFHGPARKTEEAACGELARRAMWYLGAPALRGCFQPDGQTLLASNCKVNPAPTEWVESLTSTSTAA